MACISATPPRHFTAYTMAGILLALVAFLVAAAPTKAAQHVPLRVVMDDNYPPYVMRDANGAVEGLLIDE